MSGSLNKVLLIGNLGKDPEVRQTGTGTTVVTLTLATNERYKDGSGQWTDKSEWHRVVAFGPRAETMGKYLKKGSPVFIEGQLQTRSWDDKDGTKKYMTEIVMRDFQFLDKATDRSSDRSSGGYPDVDQSAGAPDYAMSGSSSVDDEDIPF